MVAATEGPTRVVVAAQLASNCWLRMLVLLALTTPAAQAAQDSVSTRFLGSPDGQYKLTLKISGAEMTGTLQRLLIPNQTLWQQSLSVGSGLLSGFVTDAGHVIILNDSQRNSEPVVTALNSQAVVIASYSLNDLAGVLNTTAEELRQVAAPGSWMQSRAVFIDGRSVSISLGNVELLVDVTNGGLTPVFDQALFQGDTDG